jgi:PKD repeat protein
MRVMECGRRLGGVPPAHQHVGVTVSLRLSPFLAFVLLVSWLGAPPGARAADAVTLVRTFATGAGSAWNPDSPDPSGLAYIPATETDLPAERRDRLVSADGEVEEVTGAGWHNVNVWFSPRNGSAQTATMNTTVVSPKNAEPVGAAYDPARNELYLSKDGMSGRIWVHNAATGAVVRYFDANVAPYANADAEGLAFHNGVLYMVDALDDDLVKVLPGSDGIIGRTVTGNDDVVTNYDLRQYGQREPEGLDVHPQTGNIWVVSNAYTNGVPDPMLEVTPNGALVSRVSIAAANPNSAGGLAIAPASDGSGAWNIYIADRGIDNSESATENDGRIYEFRIGGVTGSPPTAQFTHTQTAGTLSVAFTDTSTGSPTSWSWDFGDGATSTVRHPTHTYGAAGTYTVALTAANSFGSTTHTAAVTVAPIAAAPTASFTASQSSGTLTVNFTDTSSGSPTSWAWNFGDGATSTAQHPSHTYAAAATYTVTLTVTNGSGSDDEVKSVTVAPVSSATNLLVNPGFELDADNNTRPDGWTTNKHFARSNTVVGAGSFAGRWQSTSNNGPSSYQQVNVAAGAQYTFTGMVNAPTTSDAFTFEIRVLWRNASGALGSTLVRRWADDTAGAWQSVSASLTAPAGATIARVQMKAGSLNGTVYVDEFRFAPS